MGSLVSCWIERRISHLFTIEFGVSCWFIYIWPSWCVTCFFYNHFAASFSQAESCVMLSQHLLTLYYLSFILLMPFIRLIYVYWKSLYAYSRPDLILYMTLWMRAWTRLPVSCWEKFCIFVHQRYYNFNFLFHSCHVLVWFWYHCNASSIKWVTNIFLWFFWSP